MKYGAEDIQWFLRVNPHLRKWINECVVCQRHGYKPEMPEQLEHEFLRCDLPRWFPMMELDVSGRCEQCAAASQTEK